MNDLKSRGWKFIREFCEGLNKEELLKLFKEYNINYNDKYALRVNIINFAEQLDNEYIYSNSESSNLLPIYETFDSRIAETAIYITDVSLSDFTTIKEAVSYEDTITIKRKIGFSHHYPNQFLKIEGLNSFGSSIYIRHNKEIIKCVVDEGQRIGELGDREITRILFSSKFYGTETRVVPTMIIDSDYE